VGEAYVVPFAVIATRCFVALGCAAATDVTSTIPVARVRRTMYLPFMRPSSRAEAVSAEADRPDDFLDLRLDLENVRVSWSCIRTRRWASAFRLLGLRLNRLFVVSSNGEMAIVDMRTLDVAYRTVKLPPELDLTPRFELPHLRALTWAGQGTLVLRKPRVRAGVAPPGVWSIDIRDGSSRLVDAAATDVRVSTNSIVAWNREAATGIKVYEPGGALRFTAVPTRRVTNVVVTARYAYVDAGGRYSVDLRNGKVSGPLASRARLVVPDLLDLP
jgi:hypothetical protein